MSESVLPIIALVSGVALFGAFGGWTDGLKQLRVSRPPIGSGPNGIAVGGVAGLFLIAVAANVASPAAEHESRAALNVASGVFAVLAVAAVAFLTTKPARGLGFPREPVRRAVLTGGVCGLAAVLPTVVVSVLRQLSGSPGAEHPMLTDIRTHPDPLKIGAVFVSAVVLAPLAEEIAFRGLIQNYLARRVKPEVAIILTAMLFLGVHPLGTVVTLAPFAFGVGYVFHQTQSLPTAVAMHAAFNAVMVFLTVTSPA